MPFLDKSICKEHLLEGLSRFESCYGKADLSGISLYYSYEGLRPWEAGAAFGQEIHLHPRFEKKKSFFAAERSEIIAHEIVHGVRYTLEEPLFEEWLAFATCRKPWRRWLGPLLSEQWVQLSILTFSITYPLALYMEAYLVAAGSAAALLSVLIARGLYVGRLFCRCKKRWGLKKMLMMSDETIKRSARAERIQRRVSASVHRRKKRLHTSNQSCLNSH